MTLIYFFVKCFCKDDTFIRLLMRRDVKMQHLQTTLSFVNLFQNKLSFPQSQSHCKSIWRIFAFANVATFSYLTKIFIHFKAFTNSRNARKCCIYPKQAKVTDSVQSWLLIRENALCFMYILSQRSMYFIKWQGHGWEIFKEDVGVWWFGNAANVSTFAFFFRA